MNPHYGSQFYFEKDNAALARFGFRRHNKEPTVILGFVFLQIDPELHSVVY
jgi:hypothetical protein